MHRGPAGAAALSTALQDAITPTRADLPERKKLVIRVESTRPSARPSGYRRRPASHDPDHRLAERSTAEGRATVGPVHFAQNPSDGTSPDSTAAVADRGHQRIRPRRGR